MAEEYSIGKEYQIRKFIAENDVIDYALVTGDSNPIHTNKEEAEKTMFGKRIAHGFLIGSTFSKIFGTEYPGKGTIYLSQTMRFIRPIYLDTWITAEVKILDYNKSKRKITFQTTIFDNNGQPAIEGEAIVKHP